MFDIQNNNCLHATNRLLIEHGFEALPEFIGNPNQQINRHRYGIKLVSMYKQVESLNSPGLVIMTKQNLFHHIAFSDGNGNLYNHEEFHQGWVDEDFYRLQGYIRFLYLNPSEVA